MRSIPSYIASQCLGALCASLLLRLLFPAHGTLGATQPAGPVTQSLAISISLFHNEHAAVGVVADAIGGVAQQTAPKLGVIAVADDDEVAAAFIGEFHDHLGRMTATGLARNPDQCDGDADTNGNQAGHKRQSNPNRRDEPDIVHSEWPFRISPGPPFPGRRGNQSRGPSPA